MATGGPHLSWHPHLPDKGAGVTVPAILRRALLQRASTISSWCAAFVSVSGLYQFLRMGSIIGRGLQREEARLSRRTHRVKDLLVPTAVLIGLGLVATVLLLCEGSTSKAMLPAGDRVAYIGTDGNLWLVESSDKPRQLTNDGNAQAPRWSADGHTLLYDERVQQGGQTKLTTYIWEYPIGESGTYGNPGESDPTLKVSSTNNAAGISNGGLSTGCAKPTLSRPSPSPQQDLCGFNRAEGDASVLV